METLVVPARFEGYAGIAQGGYVAGLLARELGAATVDLRAPVPLDTPLTLEVDGGRAVLRLDGSTLAEAEAASELLPPPPPVPVDVAAAAGRGAPEVGGVVRCFSCGTRPDSLGARCGPSPRQGVVATAVTLPDWTAGRDGAVALPFLWAPLDCACYWRLVTEDDRHRLVTARLSVRVLDPPRPGEPLVLVADASGPWEGRKRVLRSALYDASGRLRAQSASLWVRPRSRE